MVLETVTIGDNTYSIIQKIGNGSHGNVYKAMRRGSNTLYAVKESKFISDGGDVTMASIAEPSIMKTLDHPNIMKVVDVGIVGDNIYIVTPCADYDLFDRKLDPSTVREIIFQLLSALDHMHRSNVIHRDIKPSNIVMMKGRPMLIDFSISACKEGPTDKLVVTLPWRHPSLFLYMREYDIRIDVWSLSVTMYNLLAGEYLFPYDSESIYLRDVILRHPEGKEWYREYKKYLPSLSGIDAGIGTCIFDMMKEAGIGEMEIDFMKSLMRIDIDDVPLPIVCLSHPYFQGMNYIVYPPVSLPNPYPMKGIILCKRKILFEWILEVKRTLCLDWDVIANTILLFDRYWKNLTNSSISLVPTSSSIRAGVSPPNNEIQICGVACLYLASIIFDESWTFPGISRLIPGMGAKELRVYTKHIFASVGYQARSHVKDISKEYVDQLISGEALD